MRLRRALGLIATLGVAACDSGTEERSDVAGSRAVMRSYAIPAGSVPRGTLAEAAALAAPGPAVTPDLIRRGEERFLIFCSPW